MRSSARQSELDALGRSAAPANVKLLGLFDRSQLAYDLDRNGTNQPSLAEMTSHAIDVLERNPNGYLLIVEGGRIANALDASLARKALQEGRAFDDAVGVALERLRSRDPDARETTVIVTADHDHTLVMNGDATLAERTIEARPGVLGLLRPFDAPAQPANDAGGRPFTTLVFGGGEKRVRGPRSQAPALADLALADRNLRYEAAVELPSTIGGGDVMLSAAGANAARFHGTIDNTQLFALMREAMGL